MFRPPELQQFLDAALPVFNARAQDRNSRVSVAHITKACEQTGDRGVEPASKEICRWLEPALAAVPDDPGLQRLVSSIRIVEHLLSWRTRTGDATASPGFVDAHANAMLLGPAGLERRLDVWIGISLLAPATRYPDHHHSPEETYLVLSPGTFQMEGRDWFRPGPGGSFYVPPACLHAMQADEDAPLLAIWALRSDASDTFSQYGN